jgi:hypothetical protein
MNYPSAPNTAEIPEIVLALDPYAFFAANRLDFHFKNAINITMD